MPIDHNKTNRVISRVVTPVTWVVAALPIFLLAIGYQLNDRIPFYVQVAFSEDRDVSAWRQQWVWIGLWIVPLLLTIGMALVRLHKTKQKAELASSKLEYRQAMFNALFDQSNFFACILNSDGRLLEVNDRALAVIGRHRDEVMNQYFPDTPWWSDAADRSRLEASIKVAKTGQYAMFEAVHPTASNGNIYVMFHIHPVQMGEQCYIAVTGIDITDRKQAELSLERESEKNKALKLSEAQMTTSQRISGTGSCVYDFNTDIVRASIQMLRMFGLSTDITDRPLDDFLACVPKHRDLVRQTLAGKFGFPIDIADYPLDDLLAGIPEHDPVHQTLTDLINQSHQYDAEFALQPADGSPTRVIHAIGKLERDSQGTPIKIFGFIQDVTERRKTEAELKEAKIAADAANVTKSRFLATMSHEIRTPMNGILGMAQLLLMPNLTDNERHVYTRTIFSSGQTLLELLNDILDMSKIEAGKFQLDSIVFEPDAILRETQSLFSGTAHAKGLQLECQWNGLPSNRYRSDAIRIRQMLLNLVGNAIKFTKEGCVRIEGVEREQDGESALLEFSVSDTGMGIPPEKIDLLFKPFSQTDSSITREFGGSGLGLSIVCNLAKMMGGDVGVESVAGKGSRFWFCLRAKHVADGEECRSSERPTNTMTEPALLSRRVLVVEDNVVNRMVIESMLTKLGVRVTLAHDGQQALDTITQGDCLDLVMMDLNMPVMDGYGATDRIRQWELNNNRPRLPIVALTADAYEENRLHCLALGMDDFLTKPIALDALKSTLTKWLPMPNSESLTLT